VGGVLVVVEDLVFAFVIFSGDVPFSDVASTSGFLAAEVLLSLPLLVLAVLALMGLYAYQVEEAGIFGLIAFLVALIGTMLLFGVEWHLTFLTPSAAAAAPNFLDAGPSGTLATGFFISGMLISLGWLLFALASLIANKLPRGGAVLLLIGAGVFLVLNIGLDSEILDRIGSLIFGAGAAWLGYALWTGASETVSTEMEAV
jgi:hypothetical protein